MVSAQHLVRVGSLGHVGRFASVDGTVYPRGARVVCRTVRGLELGQVLSTGAGAAHAMDGALLRGVTVEDDLLWNRLQRHRDAAFHACCGLIHQRGIPATLVDVEHLFDGESIYFYFLGDVTGDLETLTDELARTYDVQVQFRRFADTLEQGCGPACGTDDAAGCGAGSCGTCAVAAACQPGALERKLGRNA